MKITVMSKKQIEKETPDTNTLVISFRDPQENVHLKHGWKNVVVIECHDIDPEECKMLGARYDQYDLFHAGHARKILYALKKNGDSDIIVHCHQGVSRSTAIGNFLAEYYDHPVQYLGRGYNPNKFIYEVIKHVNAEETI